MKTMFHIVRLFHAIFSSLICPCFWISGVDASNLRSLAPIGAPNYMDHAGNVKEIADRRHDVGVDKGRLLAVLHTECELRYKESHHVAEKVLAKAREQAEDAGKRIESLKEKLAAAKDTDWIKDLQSGQSPRMMWNDKIANDQAEKEFYMQIVANAKLVLKETDKGVKDTAALKQKLQDEFHDIDKFEDLVSVEVEYAKFVIEEEEMLEKQWISSSKDYSCGAPPIVDHAKSVCKVGDTKHSPRCEVTCLSGYDDPKSSMNTLRCQKQGKFGKVVYGEWVGMAKCVGRMCGKPPQILKAKTVVQMIRYPHLATYNCYEGNSQDEMGNGTKSFSIPCDKTGHFDQNHSHTCQLVKCGASPYFPGTEPIAGNFFFSDTLNFTCEPGRTLDETPGGLTNFSISCQATGRFSQGHKCKRIRCGPPPEYEETTLLSPPGEKRYDDVLEYKCQDGYSLDQQPSGPQAFTLRCDGDGEFSLKGGPGNEPVPQCRPVSAGMLAPIEHAQAKLREMFYGESIVVTADTGYSIGGKAVEGLSFVASVTPYGSFSGLAKFQPVHCGTPPVVGQAKTSFAMIAGVYGNVLNYVCVDGYSTDRSASSAAKNFSIQCEADGDYSEVPDLGYCANIDDCLEHTCGPRGVCVDKLLNYSCDCESGYEQIWNNETSEFMCGNVDDCGADACGIGECRDRLNGFECICPTGYKEEGEGKEKTCRAVICGNPPASDYAATSPIDAASQKASYPDQILYQCDVGWTLNGTAIGKNHFSIDCLPTAKFTETPSCQAIKCPDAPKVEHTTATSAMATFNQSIKYACDAGYTIDGTPNGDGSFGISCLVTGTYSEASKCRPVNCGEPDELANAHRPDGSLVYKESLTYKCLQGFSLDGKSDGLMEFEVKCHADGKLDPLAACLPKVCGEPPKRINSLFAAASDEGAVSYPRTTEVTCRDGYTVDGSPGGNTSFSVACLSAGKFDDYNKGECQPVRCGLLPVMPNATLDHVRSSHKPSLDNVNFNFAMKAVFKCLPGFSTGGEPAAPKTFVAECLSSGEISAPAADMQCRNINDCERHTCGPKGECIDLIGLSPAYTCLCEHGFELQTKANGEKSCGNTDDCKDMDCGVGVCVDLIGDYTCHCPSGYQIGHEDGVKTCLPVKCLAEAPVLDNGKMLSAHAGMVDFPTTLRYKCDTGFSVDGSVADAKREFQGQCKPNGQFDGMMSCQRISCGSPRVLPFSMLVLPASPLMSIEYDEVVRYRCFDGHTIGGKPGLGVEFTVTCPDDGILTEPKVCEPVKCGRAPRIPKCRAAIAGDVFFGMNLKYKCDTGYTLDGSPQGAAEFRRHCQQDGTFSDLPAPEPCQPVYGGKAPALEHAVMTEYAGRPVAALSPSVYYPNGLEYQCSPGYSENGAPSGPTKLSARVNSVGKFSPALSRGCLPITYAIRGLIRDGSNGQTLDGVSVQVQAANGSVRSSRGFYNLMGIQAGNLTLVYKRDGYIDFTKSFLVNGNLNIGGAADVSLSPKMKADQWRAVLKWAARPADLDTYYVDGNAGGTRVFWARRSRRSRRMKAVLEQDATNGYGPETMYFSEVGKCPANERYCDIRYWINDYDRSGKMKDISKAVVTLYNGERMAGSYSIEECKNTVTPDGNWWHVFTIDGRHNRLKWNCKQGPGARDESMLEDVHHVQLARKDMQGLTPVSP